MTREALLREADHRKLKVTADKLERWTRRGLVPRPITQNFGGRAGKQALYPTEAIDQLAAVSEALSIDRRLDRAAFLVWWWGFTVEMTQVREFLSKIATDLDDEIAELHFAQEDGTIERLIDESATVRLKNKVMGRARRRVGRDAFPTIMRILVEAATGSLSELQTDYATNEDEGLLFERAIGLVRARSDVLPDGSEPWLSSSPEENLRDISSLMSNRLSDVMDAASNSELAVARDEAVPIVEVLAAIGPLLEAQKGRDAYGITEFGRVLNEMTVKDLAQFFLIWLKLRKVPLLQPGIEEIGRSAREVLASRSDA